MKDYHIVDANCLDVENMLFDNELNLSIDTIAGVTVDNYFIDDYNEPTLVNGHRVKPRRHLIALEEYPECFNDDMEVIITDDTEHYYSFKRDFLENELKENDCNDYLTQKELAHVEEMLIKCNRVLDRLQKSKQD